MSARREDDPIAGDRGPTLVLRAASLQSRLSNLLALALVGAVAVAAFAWYYAHAMARPAPAMRAASVAGGAGDTAIPSIGRIEPPAPVAPLPLPELSATGEAPAPALPAVPLDEPAIPPASPLPGASAAPPARTPAELREERELAGAVFVPQSAAAAPAERPPADEAPAAQASSGELGPLLKPGGVTAVRAQTLPTRRLLLPKGSFIDCTLETAIDSTLPGLTTCVTATDAFGADGSVVLLERGTKLLGETRGQVQQGSARVFVLWSEARTPAGVIVPLASPGADELGRSGLAGEVNRHFWQRFGAALLISVIDGATEGAVQSSRSGSGAVVINPGASQSVTTEVLRSTVSIPPTVTKKNGDRIAVIVARDVDFRSVYELRSVAAPR